jgi:putative peptidoglycan lipid II flippase
MDTKQLAKYARHFFSGTLLSRVTGLGREMIMAASFGATPLVAAFWMAFRFSHLLRRILGEGALNCAFVPHFEEIQARSPKEASRFFWDLSTSIGFAVLFLVIIAEGVLGFSLYCAVSPSTAQVIHYTMRLLPSTLFITLFALNQSYLNCLGKFFLPSFAPAIMNLTWILGVVFVWSLPQEEGLSYLTHLIVIAFLAQWLLTVPPTLRDFYQKEIFILPSTQKITALLKPFSFALIGVTATQINSALDTLFARVADPSGPAYLWYAIRLQQLPLALFGVGIATTLFPSLTKAIKNQEMQSAEKILSFGITRTLALMIPITVGIFFCAPEIVKLVFCYGAFDGEAFSKISSALQAYGASLIPVTLLLIFASTFYSKGDFTFPALISVLMVVLNICLNSLFVFGFGWGAISVAYATTISSALHTLILIMKVSINLKAEGLVQILACTAAGSAAVLVVPQLFEGKFLALIWKGGVFTVPFLVMAQILHAPLYGIIKQRSFRSSSSI